MPLPGDLGYFTFLHLRCVPSTGTTKSAAAYHIIGTEHPCWRADHTAELGVPDPRVRELAARPRARHGQPSAEVTERRALEASDRAGIDRDRDAADDAGRRRHAGNRAVGEREVRAIGDVESLIDQAKAMGQNWLRGIGMARRLAATTV